MFFHRGHRLKMIERELRMLAEMMCHMTAQIDALKAQVSTTISLETQTIAILKGGGLPASDLADVVTATAQLKTSSDALASALGTTGGGGTSTEATDAQSIITSAQAAANDSGNPTEVTRLVAVMQASAASLSGAFSRNTPPLSSSVTQQEVAALDSISRLVSNLAGVASDPNQVTSLCAQIQNETQSLAAIIAANPRGNPPPPVARRVAGR